MVEGASDETLRCRRRRSDEARAPPTAQERGPPSPLSRGGMKKRRPTMPSRRNKPKSEKGNYHKRRSYEQGKAESTPRTA